jgi:hypothetical protein
LRRRNGGLKNNTGRCEMKDMSELIDNELDGLYPDEKSIILLRLRDVLWESKEVPDFKVMIEEAKTFYGIQEGV